MGFGALLLLAVGLSMDAFAVSVCKGLSMKKATLKAGLTCGVWFGGFQALMPLIGYFLGQTFAGAIQAVDHWIAFALLAVIGANMLKEAFGGCDECQEHDADLSPRKMFPMAVATSIDALAVGISFACTNMDTFSDIALPIIIIGVVSFILSIIGNLIGVSLGKHINLRMELWGGIILIGIGIRILVEHLS